MYSSNKSSLNDRPIRVACIGGGQLGRMMAMEAPRLNIQMFFMDPAGIHCPAASITPNILHGPLQDADKIRELVQWSAADVLTIEIEHVNSTVMEQLGRQQQVQVRPSGRVVALIQDKYQQKVHFDRAGIAVPQFVLCDSIQDVHQAAQQLGLPLMLKKRLGAYDGKGNAVLNCLEDIQEALQKLGVANVDEENATNLSDPTKTSSERLGLYAEGWVDFDCEIAVMVVRSALHDSSILRTSDGDLGSAGVAAPTDGSHYSTRCYPAVNAIQHDSICRVVLVPARHVPETIRSVAEQLAIQAIDSLPPGASGVFGVEMFVTRQGQVLLNEVAPRPHNTGHYTQDACVCSQFENHLRAICGLPLGSTTMKVEAAAMVNVLGAQSGTLDDTIRSSNVALTMSTASVHWYGKEGCRKGRKMGHINLTGNSNAELDQDLAELLRIENIPSNLLPGQALSNIGKACATPLVGVIMGSQSDLPTMNAAVEILKKFYVPYEVDIVSAHRTPDKLIAYSRQAIDRGIRVLIAGAGGAAHLPGMVAALTPLPVIGVPVKTSTLNGIDSLYSIVQMPRGIPVATVAIGNAMNAGLLAVRILSTSRSDLRRQMIEYQREMKDTVDASSAELLDLGSEAFLEQMSDKNKSVNV